MLNLLRQSALYRNLTPGERAVLRLVEFLIVSAVVAGLVAVYPVLSTHSITSINWSAVLSTFLSAAVVSLYAGVSKYFKSFGDPPLLAPPNEQG